MGSVSEIRCSDTFWNNFQSFNFCSNGMDIIKGNSRTTSPRAETKAEEAGVRNSENSID